jgi:thioredoxin-related protein
MKYPLLTISFLITVLLGAQDAVHWRTFECAQQEMSDDDILLVIIYSNSCDHCEHFRKALESDSLLIHYINENFIPVQLEAHATDTFTFNKQFYWNKQHNSTNPKHSYVLRYAVKNQSLGFPSFLFFDSSYEPLTEVMRGYTSKQRLWAMLHFVANHEYMNHNFNDYLKFYLQNSE